MEFTSNGNLFQHVLAALTLIHPSLKPSCELPPMVTFDIADVERDGEGKCEENPEFHK